VEETLSSLKRKRAAQASPTEPDANGKRPHIEAPVTPPPEPPTKVNGDAEPTCAVSAPVHAPYVEVDEDPEPPALIPEPAPAPAAKVDEAPGPEEASSSRPVRRAAGKKRGSATKRTTTAHGPAAPRPPPRPRRAAADMGPAPFAGLTRPAIEDLTAKHTERNNVYYYAVLEQELVRRAGARPESPGMKVRTIAQRLAEEAERGRGERAARRARRSGESDFGGDEDGEEEDALPALRLDKHVRGAGEDEDYETPVRKKAQAQRGVRWDRALFAITYLDEIEVQEHRAAEPGPQARRCLASRAKVATKALWHGPSADPLLRRNSRWTIWGTCWQ
jgi:hypothetical protein